MSGGSEEDCVRSRRRVKGVFEGLLLNVYTYKMR